jgi:pSer/pThr/pTyr-binding forkhead associated (FHA) protein
VTGIALTVSLSEGQGEPLRLVFGGGSVSVGRAVSGDLCLPDPAVSARHAEVRREGRDWYLCDLGSTNGTRLNGTPLSVRVPRLLRTGDEIAVARFRLGVETEVPIDSGTEISTALLAKGLVREVLAHLRPAEGAPSLRVVAGPDAGRCVTLAALGIAVRLGRGDHCDLRLTDALVSREHALVRRDTTGLVLIEIGSTHRTLINGEPIAGLRRLSDRDEIQVGNSRIVVSDLSEALAADLAELPDEVWRSTPATAGGAAAVEVSGRPRRLRLGWEEIAVVLALLAMAGAAYLVFTLLEG